MPPRPAQHGVRYFRLRDELPSPVDIRAELDEYVDVLMGREDPPHDNGVLTLMETAQVYYSRAMEITMLIQRAESMGAVTKGSSYYKLRTGELRSFIELAKSAIDLGSRRMTQAQLEWEMRHG